MKLKLENFAKTIRKYNLEKEKEKLPQLFVTVNKKVLNLK